MSFQVLFDALSQREPALPPDQVRGGLPDQCLRSKPLQTSFYQRAAAVLERAKGLISGDFGEDFVIVPGTLRLFRLLDLEQEHAVDHTAVVAQHAICR
jgi:hypothetical protein